MPTSKLIPLKTVTKACNEDAIRALEEALEKARAGELVAVAIATVMHDGSIARSWSRSNPCGPLIGAVAYLQHELLASSDFYRGGGDDAA